MPKVSRFSPVKVVINAIRKLSPRRGTAYLFATIGITIISSIILMAVLAPYISPFDPIERAGDMLHAPSGTFIMGTDHMGRDLFSRIIYGSRIVVQVVFMAVSISLLCGVSIGMFSGYIGGKIDTALSVVMDSLYSFPSLLLAIILAITMGPGMMNAALALGVIYIPTYFRMIRSQVLSLKEEPFVETARTIGAKGRTIMLKYLFPNTISSVPVILSMNAADSVLVLAALSFLGLGIPAPTPSWGVDLRMGRAYLASGMWWPSTFPGLMIVFLTLGFSLFGEGLTEILNPELAKEVRA